MFSQVFSAQADRHHFGDLEHLINRLRLLLEFWHELIYLMRTLPFLSVYVGDSRGSDRVPEIRCFRAKWLKRGECHPLAQFRAAHACQHLGARKSERHG